MKRNAALFFCLFLLFCKHSTGQNDEINLEIDSVTKMISYTDVLHVDSVSKQELYLRAREWFTKYYNNAENVLQMDDKEGGRLIGKSRFKVFHSSILGDQPSGHIHYTLTFYIKDGRYKYEISDFYHTGEKPMYDGGTCEYMLSKVKNIWDGPRYKYYLQQIQPNVYTIIQSFIDVMNTPASKAKDNW
jgi:hypothetical protein